MLTRQYVEYIQHIDLVQQTFSPVWRVVVPELQNNQATEAWFLSGTLLCRPSWSLDHTASWTISFSRPLKYARNTFQVYSSSHLRFINKENACSTFALFHSTNLFQGQWLRTSACPRSHSPFQSLDRCNAWWPDFGPNEFPTWFQWQELNTRTTFGTFGTFLPSWRGDIDLQFVQGKKACWAKWDENGCVLCQSVTIGKSLIHCLRTLSESVQFWFCADSFGRRPGVLGEGCLCVLNISILHDETNRFTSPSEKCEDSGPASWNTSWNEEERFVVRAVWCLRSTDIRTVVSPASEVVKSDVPQVLDWCAARFAMNNGHGLSADQNKKLPFTYMYLRGFSA